MYWNSTGKCPAKEHPHYNLEKQCIDCESSITPDEIVVHLAYKHLDRPTEVGPIVGHAKCFPNKGECDDV